MSYKESTQDLWSEVRTNADNSLKNRKSVTVQSQLSRISYKLVDVVLIVITRGAYEAMMWLKLRDRKIVEVISTRIN